MNAQQLLRHTDQTPVTTTFSHALYFWESAHTSTNYPKSLLKVRLSYKPILSTSLKSSAYKVDTNQNINQKAHFLYKSRPNHSTGKSNKFFVLKRVE